MPSATTSRRTYLDILRIIASFLVCFNHSDGFHIFLYQEADGNLMSWVNVILSVLAKMNIPLFFMLTGALLLDREESYRALFTKRIPRFAALLFAFSLAKYLLDHPEGFAFTDFFLAAISGNVNMSYWYLFAYLAFLFALPFLRKIARQLTGQDVVFLVVMRLIMFSVLPALSYLLMISGLELFSLSSDFQVPFSVFHFLFYPLVGYYLANRFPVEKLGKREVLLCLAVILTGTAVSAAMTYHEGTHFGFTQNYLGLFDFSSAIALFLLARFLFEKVSLPRSVEAVLAKLSSFTLGIYLFEPLTAIFLYDAYFGRTYMLSPVLRMGSSFLWCLFIMVSGSLATWLLRKIPGLKKFI